MASSDRRPRRERSLDDVIGALGDHGGSPVPAAMPGPRTPRERALALTVAASFLVAASSLGMGRSPAAPPAPDCVAMRPGEVSWYDPDGCWERQGDGGRRYRTTTSSGIRTYHPSPPPQSRYWQRPSSRWSFWSSSRSGSSGSSYRGSGSSGG